MNKDFNTELDIMVFQFMNDLAKNKHADDPPASRKMLKREFEQTIKQLILEEVIGEDKPHAAFCDEQSPKLGWCVCTNGKHNELRAEQRKALGGNHDSN